MANEMIPLESLEMTDITNPDHVEIQIRHDGRVVWVNVNGICRLRCCMVENLELIDERSENKTS